MMYIACFVHFVYWFLPYTSAATSLILVEMPVIFFVSGASARLSRPRRFWETLSNRCKRVLLPYYVYAALSLLIIYLWDLAPSSFSLRDFLKILLAREIPGLPYAMHLWFIAPYLIIAVSFHFQRRLAEKWGLAYLLLAAAMMVCTDLAYHLTGFSRYEGIVSIWQIICMTSLYIFCYNVFFVAGFVCYRRVTTRTTVIILTASALLLVILSKGRLPDFQLEKFPPSTLYMLYGIVSLSALSLIAGNFRLPFPRIVDFWNRHIFTIYLYHNYGMWLFVSLIGTAILTKWPLWVVVVVGIVSLFIINTALIFFISKAANVIGFVKSKAVRSLSGLMRRGNKEMPG